MSNQALLSIPRTTEYTIVFPLDPITKRYDSAFYSLSLTDGRVSTQEINKILAEINHARKSLSLNIPGILYCLIFVLILCVPINCYFIFWASVDDYVLPCSLFGCCMLFMILLWTSIVRIGTTNNKAKAKCTEICNRHNLNFVSRGLRWHVPVNFPQCIELWKDYRGIYMPTVNQQPYPFVPNYGAPNQNIGGTQQFMGGEPQFQNQNLPQLQYPNYPQGYQEQPSNNMYIPSSQV